MTLSVGQRMPPACEWRAVSLGGRNQPPTRQSAHRSRRNCLHGVVGLPHSRGMSKKPGWYKDPWPGMPGEPPLLRCWDGRHWTEHARTPEEAMQPAYVAAGPPGAYAPAAPAFG